MAEKRRERSRSGVFPINSEQGFLPYLVFFVASFEYVITHWDMMRYLVGIYLPKVNNKKL